MFKQLYTVTLSKHMDMGYMYITSGTVINSWIGDFQTLICDIINSTEDVCNMIGYICNLINNSINN